MKTNNAMIINVNTPPVTPKITGIVAASLELSALEESVVTNTLPTTCYIMHKLQTITQDSNCTKHRLYLVIHSNCNQFDVTCLFNVSFLAYNQHYIAPCKIIGLLQPTPTLPELRDDLLPLESI